MNLNKQLKLERAVKGARIGGFIGMLAYYIPLLAGLIKLDNLIQVIIFFFLSSLVVACLGAVIGVLTTPDPNKEAQ